MLFRHAAAFEPNNLMPQNFSRGRSRFLHRRPRRRDQAPRTHRGARRLDRRRRNPRRRRKSRPGQTPESQTRRLNADRPRYASVLPPPVGNQIHEIAPCPKDEVRPVIAAILARHAARAALGKCPTLDALN
jgi:hypothetical protein